MEQKGLKNKFAIRQFAKWNRILKETGFDSYQEFLKSPVWAQAKKRIARKIAQGKSFYSVCWCCGSKDNLQLHHLKYTKSNLRGAVGNDLKYLCRSCHETVHLMTKLNPNISIKTATKKLRKRIRSLEHRSSSQANHHPCS
jgi:hypothetical protein